MQKNVKKNQWANPTAHITPKGLEAIKDFKPAVETWYILMHNSRFEEYRVIEKTDQYFILEDGQRIKVSDEWEGKWLRKTKKEAAEARIGYLKCLIESSKRNITDQEKNIQSIYEFLKKKGIE